MNFTNPKKWYAKMVLLRVAGGSPSDRLLANPNCGRRPDRWARKAIEIIMS